MATRSTAGASRAKAWAAASCRAPARRRRAADVSRATAAHACRRNGRWPKWRRAGCCPGCRSRSASASSSISPPTREPSLWAACRWRSSASRCRRSRAHGRSLSARARRRRASPPDLPSRRCRPRASRIRSCSGRSSSVTLSGFVEIREERERTDRIVGARRTASRAAHRRDAGARARSRSARARRRRSAASSR